MFEAARVAHKIAQRISITNEGCWEWLGKKDRHGYGHIYFDGKHRLAHRVVYSSFVKDIPAGLQVDHLCRNRCCINPDHMELVTGAENTARGVSFSAINSAKTHCIHGHELAADNVYMIGRGRACRKCRNLSSIKYHAKKRAQNMEAQ